MAQKKLNGTQNFSLILKKHLLMGVCLSGHIPCKKTTCTCHLLLGVVGPALVLACNWKWWSIERWARKRPFSIILFWNREVAERELLDSLGNKLSVPPFPFFFLDELLYPEKYQNIVASLTWYTCVLLICHLLTSTIIDQWHLLLSHQLWQLCPDIF